MLRTEREWWGMMEGGWAGKDYAAHRQKWAEEVSAADLELFPNEGVREGSSQMGKGSTMKCHMNRKG